MYIEKLRFIYNKNIRNIVENLRKLLKRREKEIKKIKMSDSAESNPPKYISEFSVHKNILMNTDLKSYIKGFPFGY